MSRSFFCCHRIIHVSVLCPHSHQQRKKLSGFFSLGYRTWNLGLPLGFHHVIPLQLTIQITIVLFAGCFVNKAKDSSFYETSIVSSVKSAIHINLSAQRWHFSPQKRRHLQAWCDFSHLLSRLLEICGLLKIYYLTIETSGVTFRSQDRVPSS